jgi:hypothetical protein
MNTYVWRLGRHYLGDVGFAFPPQVFFHRPQMNVPLHYKDGQGSIMNRLDSIGTDFPAPHP